MRKYYMRCIYVYMQNDKWSTILMHIFTLFGKEYIISERDFGFWNKGKKKKFILMQVFFSFRIDLSFLNTCLRKKKLY